MRPDDSAFLDVAWKIIVVALLYLWLADWLIRSRFGGR